MVLADQSLKMLRLAKSRMTKLNGKIPDNMVFLHADALALTFRPQSFSTILFQNLLHCFEDTRKLLTGIKELLTADAGMFFTTLVRNNRMADGYLKALTDSGKLVSRTIEDHKKIIDELKIPMQCEISGNMAFIVA